MIDIITRVVAVGGYPGQLPLPHVAAKGHVLYDILQLTIGVVAALSVLFVVIGGMRFVFSAGDPQAAGKARSTIIYAAVGLVLALLAESIVAFVLNTASK